MDALLEVRDLKIAFDSPRGVIRAVRGVSFSLCAGETLAVVGESGCGKSVLCKSLLGLLPHRGRVAGGSILYAGRDLAAMGERELEGIRGKEIALVLQNPMSALNPSLPVGSQIARAARAHGGISRAGAKARALELMALTGIPEPARRYGDYPHQFSGGMLQRCVLASALACGPKLLVADEPTTALDATVQAQMLDLLRDIQHQTARRSSLSHTTSARRPGSPGASPSCTRAGSSRSAPRRKSTTTRAIPTPGGCSRPFPPRRGRGSSSAFQARLPTCSIHRRRRVCPAESLGAGCRLAGGAAPLPRFRYPLCRDLAAASRRAARRPARRDWGKAGERRWMSRCFRYAGCKNAFCRAARRSARSTACPFRSGAGNSSGSSGRAARANRPSPAASPALPSGVRRNPPHGELPDDLPGRVRLPQSAA